MGPGIGVHKPGLQSGQTNGGIPWSGVSIVAFPTGGQTNATTFNVVSVNISTCATSGDSIKPSFAAIAARMFWVYNSGANSCDLFPSTGDAFESQSANTAFSIGAGEFYVFYCAVNGIWRIK